MSNTPTDEELDSVLCHHWPAFSMQAVLVRMWLRDAMRAALAKWGTPQQVVQEPFCYVSVNKQGDITRTMKRKDKWTNIPLYTTPQPAQVQPVVREPLTTLTIAPVRRFLADRGIYLSDETTKELIVVANGITQNGGSNAE